MGSAARRRKEVNTMKYSQRLWFMKRDLTKKFDRKSNKLLDNNVNALLAERYGMDVKVLERIFDIVIYKDEEINYYSCHGNGAVFYDLIDLKINTIRDILEAKRQIENQDGIPS